MRRIRGEMILHERSEGKRDSMLMERLYSYNVDPMIPKISETRLLLDNIRSVHNVGSIFRIADTIGISKIYCLGTTPTPLDRFGRKRNDFTKVSLGTEEAVPWEHLDSTERTIKKLKKENFVVIALEQTARSVDYKNILKALDERVKSGKASRPEIKLLIIFGNEVDGVNQKLLNQSNIVADIPMKGKKESLNVAVAAGIFLYRILDV